MGLKAKDIMDPHVLTVEVGTDVLSCAKLLATSDQRSAILGTGTLPIRGIVTEWDIVEKVVAVGRDPASVRVEEIASFPVETCPVDLPTDEVVARMAQREIRRMVVCHGDRVVGIITPRCVMSSFRKYIDQLTAEIAGYGASEMPTGN